VTAVTELADRTVALARDGDVTASLQQLWAEDRFLRHAAAAHASQRRRDDRSYEDAIALFELAEVARRRRAFRGPRPWARPEWLLGLWLLWHVIWLGLQGSIYAGWTGAAVGSLLGTALALGLGFLLRREMLQLATVPIEDRSPGHVARIATTVLAACDREAGPVTGGDPATRDAEVDAGTASFEVVLAAARAEQRDEVLALLTIAGVAHAQRLAHLSVRHRRAVPLLDDVRTRLIADREAGGRRLPHPSSDRDGASTA
jgi:hypothetical protein